MKAWRREDLGGDYRNVSITGGPTEVNAEELSDGASYPHHDATQPPLRSLRIVGYRGCGCPNSSAVTRATKAGPLGGGMKVSTGPLFRLGVTRPCKHVEAQRPRRMHCSAEAALRQPSVSPYSTSCSICSGKEDQRTGEGFYFRPASVRSTLGQPCCPKVEGIALGHFGRRSTARRTGP